MIDVKFIDNEIIYKRYDIRFESIELNDDKVQMY
jgi:hypothetical protein